MSRGLVIDLFAGGGGASAGIEAALGRPVDIAINHDRIALAAHKANHPKTRHLEADIWEVKPTDATGGRPVDLLWASPDCFPAGTLILTSTGYQPIEKVDRGDLVFTHNGRWRRVTECFKAQRDLIEVRGHGHPGLRVSSEHPFWRRTRTGLARRQLSAPTWMKASGLGAGDYWATPCEFPAAPIPPVGGRGMAIDERLMWLAGRYLGDGWTRINTTRAELVLICGKHETLMLRGLLAAWPRLAKRAGAGELAWHEREVRTARQFSTNHRGLVEWLRAEFGHGAARKRIPGWALGMPWSLREALLEGYLSADGHRGPLLQEANTVSGALAFGIKALASSLGKTVTVYKGENRSVIEGREVQARPIYSVRWRHAPDPAHSQVTRDHGVEWCPIREVQPIASGVEVFNLSVDEDESYVAEGVIVHNCTHFSVAKGNVPKKQKIRSLAWAVARWAAATSPALIVVENVSEFRTWGPLGKDNRPVKRRMGVTFLRWKGKLEKLGYRVEFTILDAAEHGAPTRRRRLFVVARRDGQPVRWPVPTHGPGRQPFRTAAECIDWALACPSIFERKKPLAEKTLWRIAQGIKRFVIENPRPFIVQMSHGEAKPGKAPRWGKATRSLDEPLPTVTGSNDFSVCAPILAAAGGPARSGNPRSADEPLATVMPANNRVLASANLIKVNHGAADGKVEARGESIEAPLSTVTASRRGHGMVAATLVQTGYGEREGQAARVPHVDKPLGTIMATGQKHAAVGAFLAKHYGGVVGQEVQQPVATITSKDHHALVSAVMVEPGQRHGRGQKPADEPLSTVVAKDRPAVSAATLVRFNHDDAGVPVDEPMPTVLASGLHVAEVRAFLTTYYGGGKVGQVVDAPLRTVTTKDRLGLVTVEGSDYQIVDIGMRMLEPEELLRAQFGRFASGYDLSAAATKSAKVRLIGNSVCPEVAEAVVRANVLAAAEAVA